MIERLVTTLGALAAPPPPDLASPDGRRLAADCADAARLELDCPQQTLTLAQRARLRRLVDLLDGGDAPSDEVRRAAALACSALGVAPADHR
jgi:hypothetical protein